MNVRVLVIERVPGAGAQPLSPSASPPLSRPPLSPYKFVTWPHRISASAIYIYMYMYIDLCFDKIYIVRVLDTARRKACPSRNVTLRRG